MSGTLLLNATYEPICVVPVRRAVILVLSERAEVISVSPNRYRSERTSLAVPTVIRLVKFVTIPFRKKLRLTRRALLVRDKQTCAYCGHPGDTIDHIVPRCRGGAHTWENVALACKRCNGAKADKLHTELGWKLRVTPYAPKGTSWVIVALGVVEVDWQPYLAAAA